MPDAPEYCTVDGWSPLPALGCSTVLNPRLNRPGWKLVVDNDDVEKGEYLYTIRYHHSDKFQAWQAPQELIHDWVRTGGTWRKMRETYFRFGLDILLMHRSAEPIDAPLESGDSEEETNG